MENKTKQFWKCFFFYLAPCFSLKSPKYFVCVNYNFKSFYLRFLWVWFWLLRKRRINETWSGPFDLLVRLGDKLTMDRNQNIWVALLKVDKNRNSFTPLNLLNRWGRGASGSISNRNHWKHNRKKIRSKPKIACKTALNVHILVIKTLIDPMQWWQVEHTELFAAIRDQWRRIFSAQIEEKRDPNSKNRSFLAQRPKNQS